MVSIPQAPPPPVQKHPLPPPLPPTSVVGLGVAQGQPEATQAKATGIWLDGQGPFEPVSPQAGWTMQHREAYERGTMRNQEQVSRDARRELRALSKMSVTSEATDVGRPARRPPLYDPRGQMPPYPGSQTGAAAAGSATMPQAPKVRASSTGDQPKGAKAAPAGAAPERFSIASPPGSHGVGTSGSLPQQPAMVANIATTAGDDFPFCPTGPRAM